MSQGASEARISETISSVVAVVVAVVVVDRGEEEEPGCGADNGDDERIGQSGGRHPRETEKGAKAEKEQDGEEEEAEPEEEAPLALASLEGGATAT